MRRPLALVVAVLGTLAGVALGVAAVVAGEADDSPGLQLIGVLLVVGVGGTAVRALRRRPGPTGSRP